MERTYRQPDVHSALGCSPRQIVEWSAVLWGRLGKGNHRTFTLRDACALRVVMMLRDMGCGLDDAVAAARRVVSEEPWAAGGRVLLEVERPHVAVSVTVDLGGMRDWCARRLEYRRRPGVAATPAGERSGWRQLELAT